MDRCVGKQDSLEALYERLKAQREASRTAPLVSKIRQRILGAGIVQIARPSPRCVDTRRTRCKANQAQQMQPRTRMTVSYVSECWADCIAADSAGLNIADLGSWSTMAVEDCTSLRSSAEECVSMMER